MTPENTNGGVVNAAVLSCSDEDRVRGADGLIEAARTGTAACGVTGLLVACLFSPLTRADDVLRASETLGAIVDRTGRLSLAVCSRLDVV